MKLSVKFIGAIMIVMIIAFSTTAWIIIRRQEQAIHDDAEERSTIVLNFGEACRAYARETLSPAVEKHTEAFIIEANSATFVARGTFKEFNKTMPRYRFREASLNPLNLDNRADDDEAAIIRRFQGQPDPEKESGFRMKNGEDQYYVAKPIVVKAVCLRCHESPDLAPPEVVAEYGSEHGYGWKQGEIISAMIITVPADDIRRAQAGIKTQVISGLGLAAIALVGVIVALFQRLVSGRLGVVAERMRHVAAKPAEQARIDDRAGDELASIADAFNHMSAALATSYGSLEDRVASRTRELDQRARELAESQVALLKQTRILQSVLDHMGEGVVVADEHGKLILANPATERIIGLRPDFNSSPDDWSAQYGLFLSDGVTPCPTSQLPLVRAFRGEVVDDVEMFVRHEQSPEGVWIITTARPIHDERGESHGGVMVFRDISERKRTERRLAAQHATTRVLAESTTLEEAAPKILEAICDSLGWDFGAIWGVDPQADRLRCIETWHRPDIALPKFEAITRQTLFPRGRGLPGRVWESAQPAWIRDVTEDANFPRAPIAIEENLHGAFGFPILLQGETLGVIEFFSHQIRKPDDNLLKLMASVGSQIGQFIERRRAEAALRTSEEQLESILDNAPAVIYAKDRDGRYILINRQYERLFHFTRELIVGKTDLDVFPQPIAAEFRGNDLKVLASREPITFEEVAPHDDGSHTYISTKFPLFDAAGEPYAVCGISTDITARKHAEEALGHERHLLHALMDNVPDAIYFKDAASRFIRINRALAQKNGLGDPSEALGKTDFDFFTAEHAQQAFDDEREVMRTGEPLVGKEEKEAKPDGRVTWVLTTKLPLRDADGKIIGTFGMSRDITSRKETEQALRDSEALYHSLVENLPLNVIRKDVDGHVQFGNGLYCRTVGRPLEALLGKTDHDLFPRELAEKYRADDLHVMQTRELLETVEEHQKPSGERIWVQVLKAVVLDSKESVVGTQALFWDVSARHRAEEALAASERRYRQLTEGSQDAIIVADQNGVITVFNRAAQATFGYTEAEAIGLPVTMLIPPEFHDSHLAGFDRFLATREPRVVGHTVELRGRRKNGEVFQLDLSLNAVELPEGISFLADIRDTSERHRMHADQQRMRDRLSQTERLASLGMLSAGVAHEINNPLAYVANNVAVLDRDVRGLMAIVDAYEEARPTLATASPETAAKVSELSHRVDLPYVRANLHRVLDTTRQGVKRVADIVQTLRGFARPERSGVAGADLSACIATSLEMIRGRLDKRNITVKQQCGDMPLIPCDPTQVNQVLLNLLVNAMQAIEATRRATGQIEITAHATDGEVAIDIADDGCGISEQALPHIFEPFFTTKGIGEGTGLGLSISHGIVTDLGGRFEVSSTVGQGSRFRVILPMNRKDEANA